MIGRVQVPGLCVCVYTQYSMVQVYQGTVVEDRGYKKILCTDLCDV
jgi:hypothetical protein